MSKFYKVCLAPISRSFIFEGGSSNKTYSKYTPKSISNQVSQGNTSNQFFISKIDVIF